jgi:hypothetical protein
VLSALGIHDNFFALGGHSLSGHHRRWREFVKHCARSYRCVRCLKNRRWPAWRRASSRHGWSRSERLEQADGHATLTLEPPLVKLPRVAGEEIEVSFAQQRLWFLDQLEPGSGFYNIAGRGALARRARLRRARAFGAGGSTAA